MDRHTVLRRASGVVEAPFDAALLFMNVDSGQYLMLEDTARDIWAMIDGERSIGEIVDRLTGKYEIDEVRCRAEVIAFAQSLLDQKMIEPPR